MQILRKLKKFKTKTFAILDFDFWHNGYKDSELP